MRFLIISFHFLCLAMASLTAQSEPSALLWEISGNGLSSPSYLYGTMHLNDARVFELGDSVMAKYNECDAVAVEVIMDDSRALEILAMCMMEDTELSELLSAEEHQVIIDYTKNKAPHLQSMIEKVKPILGFFLVNDMIGNSEMPKTLDEFFEDEAVEQAKKLIGLESMEEQMAMMDILSLEDQAQMLYDQIVNVEENDSLMEVMIETYRCKDIEGLYKSYQQDHSMYPPEFDRTLISDRNYTMAERMEAEMQQQSTFVAVGALHLPGATGIIQLLREKGYTLAAMPSPYNPENIHNPFAGIWKYSNWQEYGYVVEFPDLPNLNESLFRSSGKSKISGMTRGYHEKNTNEKYYIRVFKNEEEGKSLDTTEALEKFIEQESSEGFKISGRKNGQYKRLAYTDYIFKQADGSKKNIRVFEHQDQLLLLEYTAVATQYNTEHEAYFFNSLQIRQ